jgi:phosphocarrier protein HPr
MCLIKEKGRKRERKMKNICGKVIENVGLHARPASVAVTEASKYDSNITLQYMGRMANMKSIIQVMKLSVPANGEIEIQCEGEDEERAVAGIAEILEKKHIIQRTKKEV